MLWTKKKQLEFSPKFAVFKADLCEIYVLPVNLHFMGLISYCVWCIMFKCRVFALLRHETWFLIPFLMKENSAILMCTFHPCSKQFHAWSSCILVTTINMKIFPSEITYIESIRYVFQKFWDCFFLTVMLKTYIQSIGLWRSMNDNFILRNLHFLFLCDSLS